MAKDTKQERPHGNNSGQTLIALLPKLLSADLRVPVANLLVEGSA